MFRRNVQQPKYLFHYGFITVFFLVSKLPKKDYSAPSIKQIYYTWVKLMWTMFPVPRSSLCTLSPIGALVT